MVAHLAFFLAQRPRPKPIHKPVLAVHALPPSAGSVVAASPLLRSTVVLTWGPAKRVDGQTQNRLWEFGVAKPRRIPLDAASAPGAGSFCGFGRTGCLYDFIADGVHGGIVAVDLRTGKHLWNNLLGYRPAAKEAPSSLAVSLDGTSVYAQETKAIWRIDIKTGQVVWRKPLGNVRLPGRFNPPLLLGKVVVVTVSDDAENWGRDSIYALDHETGRIVWQHVKGNNVVPEGPGEQGPPPEIGATLGARGRLFYTLFPDCGNGGKPILPNRLVCLDANTGSTIWSHDVPMGTTLWSASDKSGNIVTSTHAGGTFEADVEVIEGSTGHVLISRHMNLHDEVSLVGRTILCVTPPLGTGVPDEGTDLFALDRETLATKAVRHFPPGAVMEFMRGGAPILSRRKMGLSNERTQYFQVVSPR